VILCEEYQLFNSLLYTTSPSRYVASLMSFIWQCRATFYCARVIRNSPTSTWDKNLNVGSKSSIFPTEQYFVW